jgi:hypothetical protein
VLPIFGQLSTEPFNEAASGVQIGKTPAVKYFAVSVGRPTVSGLDVSRFVKFDDLSI